MKKRIFGFGFAEFGFVFLSESKIISSAHSSMNVNS